MTMTVSDRPSKVQSIEPCYARDLGGYPLAGMAICGRAPVPEGDINE